MTLNNKINKLTQIEIDFELERCETIMGEGDWIEVPGQKENYHWEDFDAAIEYAKEHPNIHAYTLVEAETSTHLLNGFRYVNRYAYMLSRTPLPITDGDVLLYWSDDYGTDTD